MAQPLDKDAPLKFRFKVPAIVEIDYRGPDKATAAELLAKALKRGEAFLYIQNIDEFQFDLKLPNKWDAELQWTCPDCGRLFWFDLTKRNCYGTCLYCQKKFVVVEGYAFWNTIKKCDACPKRLECMLVPRLQPEHVVDR